MYDILPALIMVVTILLGIKTVKWIFNWLINNEDIEPWER